MALYDGNGKITIDEIAAQKDINNLSVAINCLNDSKRTINTIISQATTMKGATRNAVLEKATELRAKIDDMIARLNESKSFISYTVSHYQKLDQQIKSIVDNYDAGGGGYSSGDQGASGYGGSSGSR